MRQSCKIANTEEGMDNLMEFTLQRQLAEQKRATTELQNQVAELTTLLKTQLAVGPNKVNKVNNGTIVNTGSVDISNNTVNNIIYINPWDGDKKINLSTEHVLAAFSENTRLKEYLQLNDDAKVDPAIAPPYVADVLMDLVKRVHADPTKRNVYLNPKRADQVLVLLRIGKWEVRYLAEAIRALDDGIVEQIVKISRDPVERKRLSLEQQNALAMAGLLYEDGPEEYADRLKGQMTAHLMNSTPSADVIVKPLLPEGT